MAQFNADIELRLKTEALDKKLKQIERQIGGLAADKKSTAGLVKQYSQVNTQLEKATREVVKRGIAEKTNTRELRAQTTQLKQQQAAAINLRKKGGGALTGGAISASFPLLTGGSNTESILGAFGGAAGGAFGGIGGFAGGIAGSAIGRLITDAEELNKSLATLNTRIGVVGTTSQITGNDLGELASQLGITKDETLTLVEAFNGLAVAGEAAALARQFGNVGGASTAEAIAASAQDEASALAAIEQIRGIISLDVAQQLQDTLEQEGLQTTIAGILDTVLKLNQDIAVAQAEQVTFADRLQATWLGIQDIILGIDGFKGPGQIAQDRVDALGGTDTTDRLGDLRNFLEQQRRLREQYKPERAKAGGAAAAALPQSKELQLRAQILKTELAVSSIQAKRAALQLTDLEAVRAKEQLLAASLVKETQILELERQKALVASKVPGDNALINELYDDRLTKIQAQNYLLREQNGLAEKNILLQRDLVALRNEQQTEGIVQGLGRGIKDANSRSSSEMLSLRIKQLRRQEDLIGGINDKLAEQKRIESGDDVTKAAAATREIGFLQDRKAAIEALLPTLNKAEQQQLKYNQALEAVTPGVNSLVSGLREVVAGTKTAEEAFADFLNTVADQLIQTAATMIAQYIAIGLAKAFAGLGSNPGGGGIDSFGGGNPLGALTGSTPLPFLATGGTADGGQPYIVGEKGPELFIPGVTGTVTNNDQFEAARDALSSGEVSSSSSGDDDALGVLGSATSSSSSSSATSSFAQNSSVLATTASLMRENAIRSEEKSTMERSMERDRQTVMGGSGTVVIETQVINHTEYATVDQVQKSSQAAAKQARAQVFSSLRNKPATRASVGMR